MEFFYNLRRVANLQNCTIWTQNRIFLINLTLFKQKDQFWGRKKPPEAAAGHDTLVLRTKTLLAGMAHGRADRTSRRAEIPPPEEAALRAARPLTRPAGSRARRGPRAALPPPPGCGFRSGREPRQLVAHLVITPNPPLPRPAPFRDAPKGVATRCDGDTS